MPPEVLKNYMSGCDRRQRMVFTAALQCSPVFTGIKAAGLFNVPKEGYSEFVRLLQGSGVSFYCLGILEKKATLILYRPQRLESYLSRSEHQRYLALCGYEEGNLLHQLGELGRRYRAYLDHKADFPHEMGIFLEYPLADIRGFVEQNGQNCLCSGYWKVYADENAARKRFQAFDEAREQVLTQVFGGRSLKEICLSA